MKFTIERASLLSALGHVTSVVERRNTIPILSNILLSVSGEGVSFAATDLDIEIVETVETSVQQTGVATLPAHTFYEIARKLPEGADVVVEIKTEESTQVVLRAGRARFALPTLPEDEFPALSADGLTHQFELDASELARLIDKTRFAVSNEETRYYLNGVHMHATEGEQSVIRAVATDGHQLALCESPAPDGAQGMSPIIVPRKTIGEVRKLIDDVSDPVLVQVSDAKIRFSVGSAILTSKLIDGSFPDYQRVIPKNNENRLELENRSFAAAVDRVSTVSIEKSRSVKMVLETDTLTLRVSNPEAGQGTEEIPVSYDGAPMEIGFNAKYLLNVLSQIDGQDVIFCLSNANSPILIEDSGDEHALYVLMPLRV